MRFSLAFVAAMAAVAIAAPTPVAVQKRSLITFLTGAIGDLEDGLGVTALEDKLDAALGGSLTKVSV